MRGALRIVVLLMLAMPSIALARPGTTLLVDPNGTPIGGKFQRWVDQAQVPTVPGTLTFVTPQALCGAPVAGCSVGPPFYGQQYMIAASERESLYFELGHIFDWRYLTWHQRHWLARQWRQHGIPWLDSELGLRQSTEDGLEGAFAAIYGVCAADRHADIAGIGLDAGTTTATVTPAMAQPRTAASTCRFIRLAP